jgi:hypothetical protein
MRQPRRDPLDREVDAGMDAERQRRAVAGDLVEQRVQLANAKRIKNVLS